MKTTYLYVTDYVSSIAKQLDLVEAGPYGICIGPVPIVSGDEIIGYLVREDEVWVYLEREYEDDPDPLQESI